MAKAKNKEPKTQSLVEQAFEMGNYCKVGYLARQIAQDPQASAQDKANALALHSRIKNDPAVILVSLISVLFVFILSWYWTR